MAGDRTMFGVPFASLGSVTNDPVSGVVANSARIREIDQLTSAISRMVAGASSRDAVPLFLGEVCSLYSMVGAFVLRLPRASHAPSSPKIEHSYWAKSVMNAHGAPVEMSNFAALFVNSWMDTVCRDHKIVSLSLDSMAPMMRRAFDNIGVRHVTVAPVIIKNECTGALVLMRRDDTAQLGPESLMTLRLGVTALSSVMALADGFVELQDRVERLGRLFDDVSIGVAEFNGKGGLMSANRHAMNVLGQTGNLGTDSHGLFDLPGVSVRVAEQLQARQETSFPVNVEKVGGTATDDETTVKLKILNVVVSPKTGRRNTSGFFMKIMDPDRQVVEQVGSSVSDADRVRHLLAQFVQAMVAAVEVRDPHTAGHQRRVAELARLIATDMGLGSDVIEAIRVAGVIHDIGKLSVPSDLLSKPGVLTSIEFELIKTHVTNGYDIIKGVDFAGGVPEIVLQHHERLDGSGYPNAIKASQIRPEARIIAVADTVEAMVSHRSYRPALGIDSAMREIHNQAGRFFDSRVVSSCVRVIDRWQSGR